MAQQKINRKQTELVVQTKTISFNNTMDPAGNIFYKDIGNAGDWPVPFDELQSVSVIADDLQFWVSHNNASTTNAGYIRLWKWNSTARSVTITITGIGYIT